MDVLGKVRRVPVAIQAGKDIVITARTERVYIVNAIDLIPGSQVTPDSHQLVGVTPLWYRDR